MSETVNKVFKNKIDTYCNVVGILFSLQLATTMKINQLGLA